MKLSLTFYSKQLSYKNTYNKTYKQERNPNFHYILTLLCHFNFLKPDTNPFHMFIILQDFFRVSHWMVLPGILFIYTAFSSIYTAPVWSLTGSTNLIDWL